MHSASNTVIASQGDLRRGWSRYLPHYFPFAYKLALVITLLVTGGMTLLGLVVIRDQHRLLELQMANLGSTVAMQLAESAVEPLLANDKLTLEFITNNLIHHDRIVGAAVYTEEVRPVFRSGAVPDSGEVTRATAGGQLVEWSRSGERLPTLVSYLAPVRLRNLTAGYALVTFDRTFMAEAKRETLQAVGGATVVLIAMGILLSIGLSRWLMRPLADLIHGSRAISEGDYGFRFEERRNDEIGSLMLSLNTMTEGLLRKEQVEQTFSRYLSPKIAREVLDNMQRVQLGGRHVNASVLFADIVGFTALTETMQPEEVSGLLNEYFTYIARAAQATGGYVDKYIGDCAMLVFGVPEPRDEHPFEAIACAVLIQQLVDSINIWRAERGMVTAEFRVGINSGTMLAGNMGSADRMDYTVVGDAVNLASRLARIGEPGEIVISEEMHALPSVADRVVADQRESISLRGKSLPVATYIVRDLTAEYQELLRERFARIMEYRMEA